MFLPLDILYEYWLNMLPSVSIVSCLDSLLVYTTGEFQALQIDALVVFGAVD